MFGMGFGEILLIAVVAIVFLGPERLPKAMVDAARFFRKVREGVSDAKESLESELKISEMRDSALEYKRKMESSANELYTATEKEGREVKDLFKDLTDEEEKPSQAADAGKTPKREVVDFKAMKQQGADTDKGKEKGEDA